MLKLSGTRTLIIHDSLAIPQICYCFLTWKVLKDCHILKLGSQKMSHSLWAKTFYQNIMPVSYRHCNHHCIWKMKTRKRNSASLPLSLPHTKLKPQGWQGEGSEEGKNKCWSGFYNQTLHNFKACMTSTCCKVTTGKHSFREDNALYQCLAHCH